MIKSEIMEKIGIPRVRNDLKKNVEFAKGFRLPRVYKHMDLVLLSLKKQSKERRVSEVSPKNWEGFIASMR